MMVDARKAGAAVRPADRTPSGVFEGLQALRFVAALLVLITHATFYTSTRLDPDVTVWNAGTVGVDLFFVISGFVMMITSAPFIGAEGGWRYFAMRRIVRIVPMYWLATSLKIMMLLVLPGVALRAALEPRHVAFSYLFLPSVNEVGAVEPVLGVGWTLTYEMFFYAVFTIALLVRVHPLLFVGSVMIALAIWGQFGPAGTSPWAIYLEPVILYFVAGMVIAVLTKRGAWPLILAVFLTCLGLAAVLVVMEAAEWYRGSPFRFVVVIGVVAAAVRAEPWLRRVMPRGVLFLGDASYSIYLFHPLLAPMVPLALAVVGFQNSWLSVIGAIVWALISTSVIYVLVEKKVIRLGRRLPYAGRIPHPEGGGLESELVAERTRGRIMRRTELQVDE